MHSLVTGYPLFPADNVDDVTIVFEDNDGVTVTDDDKDELEAAVDEDTDPSNDGPCKAGLSAVTSPISIWEIKVNCSQAK